MTGFARRERRELCRTLLTVGPDAPTLCEGWRTRDLAAHLLLRETRPLAAAGIVVKPLAGWTARVQRSLADRPWDALVRRVERPPFWTPFSWRPIEELVNLTENFVHHEDVLRAQPEWDVPRALQPDYEAALWRATIARRRFFFRRSPVPITLQDSAGQTTTVPSSDGDVSAVVLAGPPGELLLFAFGRRRQARVDVRGSEAAVAAFRRAYG